MSKNNKEMKPKVCSECGDDDNQGFPEFDPFGMGGTLDVHMDCEEDQEEMTKRLASAIQLARQLGGNIKGGYLDELGELSQPKMTWQDFIRQLKFKKQKNYGKNDWTRPKRRPLCAGLYVPKKIVHDFKMLVAYDCSGSMDNEQIAFGLSQIQALNGKTDTAYLVPWDTVVYWEDMIKLDKLNAENIKQTVVRGRGGTICREIFEQYKANCKEVDLIIVITDGYLYPGEIDKEDHPDKDTETLWLITSHNPKFQAPFGRVKHIANE